MSLGFILFKNAPSPTLHPLTGWLWPAGRMFDIPGVPSSSFITAMILPCLGISGSQNASILREFIKHNPYGGGNNQTVRNM